MFRTLFFLCLTGALSAHAVQAPQSANDPQALVRRTLAAMGGEEKLAAIKTAHWEGHAYRNALEQSERPEGPWIPQWATFSEWRDLETWTAAP